MGAANSGRAGDASMRLHRVFTRLVAALALLFAVTAPLRAEQSFAETAKDVNQKMVKLFGSGGFQRLASYGSGVVISPDGYVLTVASHILDTQELRVHTYDGRRLKAK